MGIYFGSGAARKSVQILPIYPISPTYFLFSIHRNDVQWQPRTQPWLHTPTDRTHWDGAGGVREMFVSAGRREYVAAREKVKRTL